MRFRIPSNSSRQDSSKNWRRPQLEGNARGIGQRVMRGDDEVMRVLLEVEDECGGLPSGRVRSSVRFGAPNRRQSADCMKSKVSRTSDATPRGVAVPNSRKR
jgi:hypothetical protein